MARRLLISTRAGLGNHVQVAGVWAVIAEDGGCDIYLEDDDISAIFWKQITPIYKSKVIIDDPETFHTYKEILAVNKRYSTWNRGNVKYTIRTKKQSEVKDNEQLLSLLDLSPKPISLPWKSYSKYKKYDILIANGSLDNHDWLRKKYLRWNEVVDMLVELGYRVACIGLPNDYVSGAEDLTGIGAVETMNAIASCKVLASNDTGWYHFACAINKPTVVTFTATNITKNYDPIFHRYATILSPDIPCFPCQGDESGDCWIRGKKWKDCQDWKCGLYSPKIVAETIIKRLHKE